MTSMEAYLRLIGFPIVHMSHTFAYMPICTEDTKKAVFEEGKEKEIKRRLDLDNKLTGFFNLCANKDKDGEFASQFRYDEIELYFWWDAPSRSWIRRKQRVKVSGVLRSVPRTKPVEKLLIRVYTASPRNAELYACRLLLLNKRGM